MEPRRRRSSDQHAKDLAIPITMRTQGQIEDTPNRHRHWPAVRNRRRRLRATISTPPPEWRPAAAVTPPHPAAPQLAPAAPPPVPQPVIHRIGAFARRKDTVRSSMFARVRRPISSCAAIVASRAALRAAFVVVLLAMGHTLSPPKPLMPQPNRTTATATTAATTAIETHAV